MATSNKTLYTQLANANYYLQKLIKRDDKFISSKAKYNRKKSMCRILEKLANEDIKIPKSNFNFDINKITTKKITQSNPEMKYTQDNNNDCPQIKYTLLSLNNYAKDHNQTNWFKYKNEEYKALSNNNAHDHIRFDMSFDKSQSQLASASKAYAHIKRCFQSTQSNKIIVIRLYIPDKYKADQKLKYIIKQYNDYHAFTDPNNNGTVVKNDSATRIYNSLNKSLLEKDLQVYKKLHQAIRLHKIHLAIQADELKTQLLTTFQSAMENQFKSPEQIATISKNIEDLINIYNKIKDISLYVKPYIIENIMEFTDLQTLFSEIKEAPTNTTNLTNQEQKNDTETNNTKTKNTVKNNITKKCKAKINSYPINAKNKKKKRQNAINAIKKSVHKLSAEARKFETQLSLLRYMVDNQNLIEDQDEIISVIKMNTKKINAKLVKTLLDHIANSPKGDFTPKQKKNITLILKNIRKHHEQVYEKGLEKFMACTLLLTPDQLNKILLKKYKKEGKKIAKREGIVALSSLANIIHEHNWLAQIILQDIEVESAPALSHVDKNNARHISIPKLIEFHDSMIQRRPRLVTPLLPVLLSNKTFTQMRMVPKNSVYKNNLKPRSHQQLSKNKGLNPNLPSLYVVKEKLIDNLYEEYYNAEDYYLTHNQFTYYTTPSMINWWDRLAINGSDIFKRLPLEMLLTSLLHSAEQGYFKIQFMHTALTQGIFYIKNPQHALKVIQMLKGTTTNNNEEKTNEEKKTEDHKYSTNTKTCCIITNDNTPVQTIRDKKKNKPYNPKYKLEEAQHKLKEAQQNFNKAQDAFNTANDDMIKNWSKFINDKEKIDEKDSNLSSLREQYADAESKLDKAKIELIQAQNVLNAPEDKAKFAIMLLKEIKEKLVSRADVMELIKLARKNIHDIYSAVSTTGHINKVPPLIGSFSNADKLMYAHLVDTCGSLIDTNHYEKDYIYIILKSIVQHLNIPHKSKKIAKEFEITEDYTTLFKKVLTNNKMGRRSEKISDYKPGKQQFCCNHIISPMLKFQHESKIGIEKQMKELSHISNYVNIPPTDHPGVKRKQQNCLQEIEKFMCKQDGTDNFYHIRFDEHNQQPATLAAITSL